MADGDALRARAAARDHTLHTLVDVLYADDRIMAAWLGGSISQGAGDALSDLDLTVVVTDAASIVRARPAFIGPIWEAAVKQLAAVALVEYAELNRAEPPLRHGSGTGP